MPLLPDPYPSPAPESAQGAAIPVVVLGTDVVLAALPATAVQLAHACLQAGYHSAVPVSWGDELVAHACLEQLAGREGPAVCAACPRVVERLRGAGASLSRVVVPLAPPPVAAARYLRRLAREALLHVTYVGACPGGDDPAIDLQLTPTQFLAGLRERGIDPGEQPVVFDSVLPPDRRRHHSLPGGVPAPDALWTHGGGRRLVELTEADYAAELAEQLLAGEPTLVDVAPALGCACSGVAAGIPARNARMIVASHEPPRAAGPVVDVEDAGRGAAAAPPWTPDEPCPAPAPAPAPGPVPAPSRPHPGPIPAPARLPILTPMGGVGRRTPVSLSRLTTAGPPLARSADGRLLPRAYVARLRSLPRLTPVPAAPLFGGAAGVALATPPSATPVGREYDRFVAGVTAVVAHHLEAWQLRLDEAIAFWRRQGFRTAVLERARALPFRPDVEGLLATYAAAAEHLRRLEALAAATHPHVRGAAVFHDPEHVAAAEAFVEGLGEGER